MQNFYVLRGEKRAQFIFTSLIANYTLLKDRIHVWVTFLNGQIEYDSQESCVNLCSINISWMNEKKKVKTTKWRFAYDDDND